MSGVPPDPHAAGADLDPDFDADFDADFGADLDADLDPDFDADFDPDFDPDLDADPDAPAPADPDADAPRQAGRADETAAGPAAAAKAEAAGDPEGPRRRARRERAERRAVQQRAMAIEQARREAKRRARGQESGPPDRLTTGSVKGLKFLIRLILLTVLSVALGLVLYFTPLMSARYLVVTGTVTGTDTGTGAITREEVIEAAQIRIGTPLLQIDTDEVADRVAGIRRVASARVRREYPSAIRITIAERIPVVVKDFPDGPHLFDRDGVDFAVAPPPPGLAYIDVDNPGPADPPTKAALEVMTALRPEVVAQVGRIAAPSVASITLTLLDGRTVVWGTTDRTDEKAEKLTALLTQPGRVYDVSSPDLPTVK